MALTEETRILIADSQPVFRRGIVQALVQEADFEVTGEANDGDMAVAIALQTSPNVILVNSSLPQAGGIDASSRLKHELPSAGVIVMAGSEDEDLLFAAIKAGAAAFLLKNIRPEDLIASIRRVASGEYPINDRVLATPTVASRVLKEFRDLGVHGNQVGPVFAPLSPREFQILEGIGQGMTNKELAYVLAISEWTVKNHMGSILRKLAVNDRTQAVVYALRQGWLPAKDD